MMNYVTNSQQKINKRKFQSRLSQGEIQVDDVEQTNKINGLKIKTNLQKIAENVVPWEEIRRGASNPSSQLPSTKYDDRYLYDSKAGEWKTKVTTLGHGSDLSNKNGTGIRSSDSSYNPNGPHLEVGSLAFSNTYVNNDNFSSNMDNVPVEYKVLDDRAYAGLEMEETPQNKSIFTNDAIVTH